MGETSLDNALIKALKAAARGSLTDLATCIVKSTDLIQLGGTKAECHCYHVKLDGNCRPMVSALVDMVVAAVIDYAIPRRQIMEANRRYILSGSTDGFARLDKHARSLFAEKELTGEGGELLLFLFAERLLQLPQLFSKMSLKTSTQHYVYGSDAATMLH